MKLSMTLFLFTSVLVAACGAPRAEGEPNAPTTRTSPAASHSADCDFLRARIVAATTSMGAIHAAHPGDATPAQYYALSDASQKLADELDRPFSPDELASLAADYRAAAKATAEGAHDIALFLENSEASVAKVSAGGSARTAVASATESIVKHCKAKPRPKDCAQVVAIVRNITESPAGVEAAYKELEEVPVTTPGLKQDVADLSASLKTLAGLAAVGATVQDEGRTKIVSYERAAHKFAGLNQRADALCAR